VRDDVSPSRSTSSRSPTGEQAQATASASFVELRACAALSRSDSAIAAQGRQMLDWHARHRFCAVCGHPPA
jgi:NAD+ diphosphatase